MSIFSSDPDDSGVNLSNLPLEAKLTLEVGDFAQQVEISCADYLLPAPKGIYLKNRLEPVMTDGNAYYIYKGQQRHKIQDINLIKENVYTESGSLLIPKIFMENKARFLSEVPFIPYRGVKLAELLINEQVDSMIEYRHRRGYTLHKVLSHMLPIPVKVVEDYSAEAANLRLRELHAGIDKAPAEHPEDTITRRLDEDYASLQKEINLFIGEHTWNIYLIKLTNLTVTIERFMDYRIYCWEVEHGQKFRKTHGR